MEESQENNSMSNKLCLYEKGHFTEPEMCSFWLRISISTNSCQHYFVIAYVGINIACVTTQHIVHRPGYVTVHPPPPALSGPKFSDSENCCGPENFFGI